MDAYGGKLRLFRSYSGPLTIFNSWIWLNSCLWIPAIEYQKGTNYCTSWNFRGGFIFANFASQTLAKISTSIYVYL